MKKSNLLVLLALISLPNLLSYAAGDDDKNKGIRAGWQTSNYYIEGNSAGNDLSSFYVGFTGEKSIIPLLKFGSGLEYFQNGYSFDSTSTTASFKAHTISIPVFLKVKLGPVFALGGAGANFNIVQKYKVGDNTVDIPEDHKINVFDVPVFLGLGVKILMFSVEARYHWGMLDATSSEASSPQSQYFQVGAAVSF